MLSRVATVNRQHPEGLLHLIEVLRNHEAPNFAGERPSVPVAAPNVHVGLAPAHAPPRELDETQGVLFVI